MKRKSYHAALLGIVLWLTSCTPMPAQPAPTVAPKTLVPVVTPASCVTVTAAEALHLRAGADEKSTVLAYLYHGDQLAVISSSNGAWWYLATHNGLEGWASAKYLQITTCQQERNK